MKIVKTKKEREITSKSHSGNAEIFNSKSIDSITGKNARSKALIKPVVFEQMHKNY